jgi:hypothetical protein
MVANSGRFWDMICCNCNIGFAWSDHFGSEVVIRGYLSNNIMQLSLLELLRGTTTPSVTALMFCMAETRKQIGHPYHFGLCSQHQLSTLSEMAEVVLSPIG